jgi:hypothetical protein
MDLRQLIELMVRPHVDKIDDPDGGRCFLQLCAELVTSRSFPLIGMRAATSPGATALCSGITEQGPRLPGAVATLRGSRIAAILFTSIADYLRVTDGGTDIPREALISDLTSVLASAVRAPAPDFALVAEVPRAAAVGGSKMTALRAE